MVLTPATWPRYFSLGFPQMVVVQSTGLTCMYYTLLVVFASLYVVGFIAYDFWASRIDIASDIYSSLSLGDTGDTFLFTKWANALNSRVCMNSGYEYRAGDRSYANHTCIRPCRQGEHPNNGCLLEMDSVMQEGPSQVFMSTHVQDEVYSNSNLERRSFFVPVIEPREVVLKYQYELHGGDVFGTNPQVRSSDVDVTTVLLNRNGQVNTVLEPGTPIRLTVNQLLDMAGLTGELDAPQVGFPPNTIGGPPLGRVTGLSLEVILTCGSRSYNDQPACYVRVMKGSSGWVSMSKAIPGSGDRIVLREIHGVRVRVRTGGYRMVFDLSRTLQAVVVGLVILEWPAKLVLIFMVLCLGPLSAIYREAIFRPFSLSGQVAGLSARLLASANAFELFGGAGRPATRERILGKLVQALREHVPPNQEKPSNDVLRFIDHSWETMAQRNKPKIDRLFDGSSSASYPHEEAAIRKTMTSSKSNSSNTLEQRTTMELFEFATAFSADEPVAIGTWLNFFGRKRTNVRARLLELCFIPRDLRKRLLRTPGSHRPELQVVEKKSVGAGQMGSTFSSGFFSEPKEPDVAAEDAGEERQPERSVSFSVSPGQDTVSSLLSASFSPPSGHDAVSSLLAARLMEPGSPTSKGRQVERALVFERLDDLDDRVKSCDVLRGSIMAFERRIEQIDESLQQQFNGLEGSVMESLAKLDKRLTLLKDTIKTQIGPIDSSLSTTHGAQPASGRIAGLEADAQRHKDEMEMMKKRQGVLLKQLDSMERSIAFMAATNHNEAALFGLPEDGGRQMQRESSSSRDVRESSSSRDVSPRKSLAPRQTTFDEATISGSAEPVADRPSARGNSDAPAETLRPRTSSQGSGAEGAAQRPSRTPVPGLALPLASLGRRDASLFSHTRI